VGACPTRRRAESGGITSAATGVAPSCGDITDRFSGHAAPSDFFQNSSQLDRAVGWMRSGDHQKAIQQLKATLVKDPSSAAYLHSLLGYEFMRTDQVTAAIHCFEQAVLLLPHDPANHHNFAISLVEAGDYQRAEEEARRAHDLAPDNPEINYLLYALREHAEFPRGALNAQSNPN